MSKQNQRLYRYGAYGYRPARRPSKRRRRWPVLIAVLLLAGVLSYIFIFNTGNVAAPVKELLGDDAKKQAEERRQRIAAKVAADNAQLNTILSGWVSAHPGRDWSVVVQGLDSDERAVSLAPDTSSRAASLYKIFLLLGLFKEKSVSALKTTNLSYAGGNVSLDYCTDRMLRMSDNPCGEAIGEYIGWADADAAVASAGFSATKLNVNQPVTTANETARLMVGLYKKDLFTAEEAAYVKDKLAQQTWNKGIPAGCSGCKTYNKTGDLGFVRHDAAIIENASGSYVLVIFSDGTLYSDIAELTRQINSVMSVPLPQ